MKSLGRQIIVELYDCETQKLNNIDFIEESLLFATKQSKATIISHDFHKFNPHGVSGVIVIAESHVSIHTWPEYGYAAVDVFTCGHSIDPWIIQEHLEQVLEAGKVSSMELNRGIFKCKEGELLPFKPQAINNNS